MIAREPVVLSHGYWTRRFGSAPDVVGQVVNVEGFPMTIVGVLPRGADLPDLKVDVWAPAYVDSTTVWNNHTWSAIGRLKPGVSAADAERDLAPRPRSRTPRTVDDTSSAAG
jgi:hypothetical protein